MLHTLLSSFWKIIVAVKKICFEKVTKFLTGINGLWNFLGSNTHGEI